MVLGFNKKKKKRLQITQNKMVRLILYLGPREYVGQHELQVDLLNVEAKSC